VTGLDRTSGSASAPVVGHVGPAGWGGSTDLDAARRVFEQLQAAGIDYDDITATLEDEGVKKFADSFKELFDGVEAKRDEMAAKPS
jgi:Transaldolase/Fructose-6-phosphate aldolase